MKVIVLKRYESKLHTVKAIKFTMDCSLLGAENLVDSLDHGTDPVLIKGTQQQLKDLAKEFNQIGTIFEWIDYDQYIFSQMYQGEMYEQMMGWLQNLLPSESFEAFRWEIDRAINLKGLINKGFHRHYPIKSKSAVVKLVQEELQCPMTDAFYYAEELHTLYLKWFLGAASSPQ